MRCAAGAPKFQATNADPRPDFSFTIDSKAAREVTDLLLSTKTRKRGLLLKHINPTTKHLPLRTVQEFNDWLLPDKV